MVLMGKRVANIDVSPKIPFLQAVGNTLLQKISGRYAGFD